MSEPQLPHGLQPSRQEYWSRVPLPSPPPLCYYCQIPLSYTFMHTMSLLSYTSVGQEYWSGLLCPVSGDLPKPGIKPRSPALEADSLPSEPPGKPLIDPEFLINGVSHFFLYHTQLEFVIPLASDLHYYYEQSAFTCIIVVHQEKYSFPLSFYKIFPLIWCLPV